MSAKSERPVTLLDLENLKRDLENFILKRDVALLRWLITMQLVYGILTLGAMYFMLSQLSH